MPFFTLDRIHIGYSYVPVMSLSGKGFVLEGVGTLFVPPWLSVPVKDGRVVEMPRCIRDSSFQFTTFLYDIAADFSCKVEYSYCIPTKDDAATFYWKHRAQLRRIEQDILNRQLRRILIDTLSTDSFMASDVDSQLKKVEEDIQGPHDSGLSEYGVRIIDVHLSEKKLDILKEIRDIKEKTQIEVSTIKLRADLNYEALLRKANNYREAAQKIYEHDKSIPFGEIALKLMQADVHEVIAKSGKGVVSKKAYNIRSTK